MKNIFKKNSIIIAALAIMIIIAGYLNFSEKNNEDKTADVGTNESLDYDTYSETSQDDILDGSTVTLNEDPDAVGLLDEDSIDLAAGLEETSDEVADADQTSETASNDTTEASDAESVDEEVAQYDVSDTGEVVVDGEDSSDDVASDDDKTTAPGEAILVSTTISADYFANARLEREQKRSISKETLMEIVNNTNVTEEEKKDALNSILELTAESKMENDTETLLEAKGFSDAIVIMSDSGSVDVIINATSVTEQDIAKVEDIVKRQTGVDSKKIVISPVVEEE